MNFYTVVPTEPHHVQHCDYTEISSLNRNNSWGKSSRIPKEASNWPETSLHTQDRQSACINLPASMNAGYVTQKEPWISINSEVLVKGGRQAKITSGRLVRRYWLPKRNELIVGLSPKPPLHFSGSEITLACPILSGFAFRWWANALPTTPHSTAAPVSYCTNCTLHEPFHLKWAILCQCSPAR